MELETVKVACPVTEENPTGYYVKNKCDMTDEDVLFDEKKADPEPEKKRRVREN